MDHFLAMAGKDILMMTVDAERICSSGTPGTIAGVTQK